MKEEVKHNSYGMISVSRIQTSRGPKFFGSNLTPENYIELKLFRGTLQRTLTDDKYFTEGRNPLFKVRMTPVQFSDIIMNVGRGEGTPVTIETILNEKMDELEVQENRKSYIQNAFKKKMFDYSKELSVFSEQAKKIISKKTLSKQDQEDLTSAINKMVMEIKQNTPYYGACFEETTERLVQEVKAEIESALTHKIQLAGLQALTPEQNLIEGDTSLEDFLNELGTPYNPVLKEDDVKCEWYELYLKKSASILVPKDFPSSIRPVELLDSSSKIVTELSGVKTREDLVNFIKLVKG